MKNKIILVTAFLAVMFATTGIAAAYSSANILDHSLNVIPNPVRVHPGEVLHLHYNPVNLDPLSIGNQQNYTVPIVPEVIYGNAQASDIAVTFAGYADNLHPSFVPTSTNFIDNHISGHEILVAVSPSAPRGSRWLFEIRTTSPTDVGSLSVNPYIDPCISGQKFNDLNNNSMKDAGEPGLADWQIDLNYTNGTIFTTTTTDSNGNYTICDVPFNATAPPNHPSNNFIVQEILKPGWVQTYPTPVPPGTYNINLTGPNVTGLDFGNFKKVINISGTKFNDSNGDGIRQINEEGLTSWQIDLNDTNGNVLRTTTTTADGSYIFEDVMPGTYIVQEILQPGWNQTAPNPAYPAPPGALAFAVVDGTWNVTVGNENVNGLDFGNQKIITPQCPTGECKFKAWGLLGPRADPEKIFEIFVYTKFMPSGKVSVQDKVENLNIEAIKITDVVTTEHTGTAKGFATVNGAGNYPFTVSVTDATVDPQNAPRGTFTIDLPTYPYHNSGSLSFGVVSIIKF